LSAAKKQGDESKTYCAIEIPQPISLIIDSQTAHLAQVNLYSRSLSIRKKVDGLHTPVRL
jgi:hypothetical protein